MKAWWKILFGVICILLGAGVIVLVSSQPRGAPVTLSEPPTPAPIQVFVTGAVMNPAVYSLPRQSRVKDAIQAAGGVTKDAYEQDLNLAAPLEDGMRILVPLQPTPVPTRDVSEPVSGPASEPQITFPININTASQVELESLPGIGPATAKKIIDFRQSNGPFSDIEHVQDVSGIGPKTFENIKDLITVD